MNWYDTKISFKNAISKKGKAHLKRMIKLSHKSEHKIAIEKFFMDNSKFFKKKFIAKLEAQGLVPYVAMVIVRQTDLQSLSDPAMRQPHSDGLTTYAALNWVECDVPNRMVWYDSNVPPTAEKTLVENANYIPYNLKDLTRIDEKHIRGKFMTLVRADNPHTMEMDKDAQRITITMRFRNGWTSFDDAVKFFKNNNL
jgi:hypothetical protein